MQRELDEKDEKIRMLEAEHVMLTQTVDGKVDELEGLKQKLSMLEQEVSSA